MSGIWWFLVALLVLAGLFLRQPYLLLFGLLLASMAGASLLWTRMCLRGLSYRRVFGSTRLFYGEQTDFLTEITNAKPLPLAWLRTEDECPAALEIGPIAPLASARPARARVVNLLSLRWYERVTRRYQVRGVRRGAWTFGPTLVASGDMFGFAVRQETLSATDLLIVYPKLVPLPALGLPAAHPFGDFATRRRLVEDPLRVNGARDYVPGDSLRHVHWKATARRQALQTKTFDPSAARPVAIFLNVSTFDRHWEAPDTELQEFAFSAAASVARWAWDNHLPTGLYANTVMQPGATAVRLKPSLHPDQLLKILDALARTISFARDPLVDLIARTTPRLPMGSTIVVVTAALDGVLAQRLADLHARNYAVITLTIGAAGEFPAVQGVVRHHLGGREKWHELESMAVFS